MLSQPEKNRGVISIARGELASWKESVPPSYYEPRWYAAQTCSRHEKTVAEQLQRREIENFLPLYERVSRWKDRRVRLRLPLFDGYVFVRLPLGERLRALEIPGVVRLVGFGGLPSALRDEEIEALREALKRDLRMEPHPFLTTGRRVRITAGPLAGFEGILVRKKNQFRLVVSLDLIRRAVFVDVDAADVSLLWGASAHSCYAGQNSQRTY